MPTGKYTTEDFSSIDIEVVKAKFLELLDAYRKEQLDIVADMKELVTINVEIINPSEENETPSDNNENTEDTNNEENTSTPEVPAEPSESEDGDTM